MTRKLIPLAFLLCLAAPAFAQQCPQGYTLTGGVCVANSSGGGAISSGAFSTLPAAAGPALSYLVTDCLTASCTAGGGTLGVLMVSNGSSWGPSGSSTATGTVTSIATTGPITGGPFTVSGTIACATCVTSAASLTNNAVVLGGGGRATSTLSADTTTTHALFATAGAPAFRAVVAGDIPALVTGGACTNQVVTAIGATNAAIPTCATVISTMTDTSIAHTGVDVNTSYQVTVTHLAAALPLNQGGTNGTDAADNGGIVWSNATGYKVLAHTTTAGLPLVSGNAAIPAWGTVSGNTTQFATWTGATTSARCVHTDASGNMTIAAADCNSGSASALSAITAAAAGNTIANSTNAQVWNWALTGSQTGFAFGETTAASGSGNVLFAINMLATSTATPAQLNFPSLGTTTADGWVLNNPTAAANAAQQKSPALTLTGQGWKSNATAASQSVSFKILVEPAQGLANPSTSLSFVPYVNGSEGNFLSLGLCAVNSTVLPAIVFMSHAGSGPPCTNSSGIASNAGNVYNMVVNGTDTAQWSSQGYSMNGAKQLGWCSGACGSTASNEDTGFTRSGAGIVEVNNGTAGAFRDMKLRTANLTGLAATYNNIATAGNGVSSVYAAVATTGLTASVGTANLQCGGAICSAGTYRVTVYDEVTTVGTGTITSTIGWQDDAAARTVTSTGVATTATNFEQVTYYVRADGVHNLTYATTLSVSGTYGVYVTLERLQ